MVCAIAHFLRMYRNLPGFPEGNFFLKERSHSVPVPKNVENYDERARCYGAEVVIAILYPRAE